jgi:hypothetical protein
MKTLKTAMTFVLLLSLWANSALASGDSGNMPAQRGERYLASDDPMADVDAALSKAAANDRLALIILGGNWCHDSRGLARRLDQEPLRELVERHYETVFVDVGYYENGLDIMRRFGSPIYYATPTVLIVDPKSETLINADNRHQWGNADSISMQESVAYFRLMANRGAPTPIETESEQLLRLNAEIHALELKLAQRVESAFSVVGPLLRAYKEGREPEEFQAYWRELGKFRNAIPKDIESLYAEASRRVAAGEENIQLEFSEYPAFSWDNQ